MGAAPGVLVIFFVEEGALWVCLSCWMRYAENYEYYYKKLFQIPEAPFIYEFIVLQTYEKGIVKKNLGRELLKKNKNFLIWSYCQVIINLFCNLPHPLMVRRLQNKTGNIYAVFDNLVIYQ